MRLSAFFPESRPVAKRIDRIVNNEASEGLFTLTPLDDNQRRKYEQVADTMFVFLAKKNQDNEHISPWEDRLIHLRGNANHVVRRLANPAGTSLVNRATEAVLDDLTFRERNGTPLFMGTERTYTPEAALTPPSVTGGVRTRDTAAEAGAPPPVAV